MRTNSFVRKKVSNMPVERYKGFMARVIDATKVLSNENLRDWSTDLQTAFSAYQEALALDSTSKYTKAIHGVSQKVDDAWYGLYYMQKAYLCGSDETVKASAQEVLDIITKYGFEFLKKGYDTKFGTAATIVAEDFAKISSDTRAALNISGFIQTLSGAGDDYTAIDFERNSYRKYKKSKVSDTRKAVQEAYSNLIRAVELQAVKDSEAYEEFFGLMNEIMLSEYITEPEKADKAAESDVKVEDAENADSAETEDDGVETETDKVTE